MTTYADGEIRARIQELVGNPDVQAKKKRGKDKHKYYKKPGKGHNRDSCDACGDAGDIICCDSCPASFHLACVDPPLDEEKLPNGGWKCNSCSSQKNKNLKQVMPNMNKTWSKIEEPDDETKALYDLFKSSGNQWKKQNPNKFTLPKSFPNYEPKLPGYSKPHTVSSKKPLPKNKQNLQVESEQKYTVKRTAVCFSCDKSSRKGILMSCDYCPALFHLDCLNPPLTTVPSGLWMCPLHPEPFLESKYCTSSALSERKRVWDLGDKTLSTFSCLLNFATSLHHQPPTANNRIALPDKPKVRVLTVVDEIYKKFRMKKMNQSKLQNSGVPFFNALGRKRNQTVLPDTVPKKPKLFIDIPPQLLPSTKPSSGIDLILEVADLIKDDRLDKCLQGVDPVMVKLLAVQKLSENNHIASTHQIELPPSIKLAMNPFPSQPPAKKTRLDPTLSLVYLEDSSKLIHFHRRTIEVGNGGMATLDLQKYGHCINTSRRQAALYYDAVHGQWEMLNYSEHGSFVNGILYGCDTTLYSNQGLPQDETLCKFKEILDDRRKKLKEGQTAKNTLAAILGQEGSCRCVQNGGDEPASCWEGSAFVKKGDHLSFGCHKFVVVETHVLSESTTNGLNIAP